MFIYFIVKFFFLDYDVSLCYEECQKNMIMVSDKECLGKNVIIMRFLEISFVVTVINLYFAEYCHTILFLVINFLNIHFLSCICFYIFTFRS